MNGQYIAIVRYNDGDRSFILFGEDTSEEKAQEQINEWNKNESDGAKYNLGKLKNYI